MFFINTQAELASSVNQLFFSFLMQCNEDNNVSHAHVEEKTIRIAFTNLLRARSVSRMLFLANNNCLP